MPSEVLVEVTVVPRSSRSRITLDDSGAVKAHLSSPPVDGRANEECILLFAKLLRIAKSNIAIVRGDKSRKKTLRIGGCDRDTLFARIREQGP